jgi:Arc/MetJ-type ribon-helix-helix transcriptional regulator
MAKMTVRSTYALDPESVRRLERISRRWGVSKSEALRRAIRRLSPDENGDGGDALAALTELQRSLKLTPAKAERWIRDVRRERAAFTSGKKAR